MTLLDKEPVQRVGKIIKEFDQNLSVSVLETSARTALEAASSLGCEVGAIVKSLLFKTDNKFTLFLVAGDKKASLRKIKKNIKFDDIVKTIKKTIFKFNHIEVKTLKDILSVDYEARLLTNKIIKIENMKKKLGTLFNVTRLPLLAKVFTLTEKKVYKIGNTMVINMKIITVIMM